MGLLNSDIDLERKSLAVRQGVKEVSRRNGTEFTSGREVKVGKPKSATSKRTVPLNRTAVEMIEDLRREAYFGEMRLLCATETAATQDRSTSARDTTESSRQQGLNRRDCIACGTPLPLIWSMESDRKMEQSRHCHRDRWRIYLGTQLRRSLSYTM